MSNQPIERSQAHTTLEHALQENRRLQNVLLTGGNTQLFNQIVVYYLQVIFCTDAKLSEACGKCQSCQLIAEKKHPDVYWYGSEDKLGKDEITQIQTRISASGLIGENRAYVIEDLTKMTLQAQNAWLKFLEEPLPNVYCLAGVENANQILPTVKSRFFSIATQASRKEETPKLAEMYYDVAAGLQTRYLERVSGVDILLFLEKNIKMNDEFLILITALLETIVENGQAIELQKLISTVRKMSDANVPQDQLAVYFCLNIYRKE